MTVSSRNNGGQAHTPPRDPTLCKYPSCSSQRVPKLNGQLHNMCQQHRDSANESKRKSKRSKLMNDHSSSQGIVSDAPLWPGHICQYTGRVCYRLRATKPNGQLHKFCQFHRERANGCQQKSVRRGRTSAQVPLTNNGESEERARTAPFWLQPVGVVEAFSQDHQVAAENEWFGDILEFMPPDEFNDIVHSARRRRCKNHEQRNDQRHQLWQDHRADVNERTSTRHRREATRAQFTNRFDSAGWLPIPPFWPVVEGVSEDSLVLTEQELEYLLNGEHKAAAPSCSGSFMSQPHDNVAASTSAEFTHCFDSDCCVRGHQVGTLSDGVGGAGMAMAEGQLEYWLNGEHEVTALSVGVSISSENDAVPTGSFDSDGWVNVPSPDEIVEDDSMPMTEEELDNWFNENTNATTPRGPENVLNQHDENASDADDEWWAQMIQSLLPVHE